MYGATGFGPDFLSEHYDEEIAVVWSAVRGLGDVAAGYKAMLRTSMMLRGKDEYFSTENPLYYTFLTGVERAPGKKSLVIIDSFECECLLMTCRDCLRFVEL